MPLKKGGASNRNRSGVSNRNRNCSGVSNRFRVFMNMYKNWRTGGRTDMTKPTLLGACPRGRGTEGWRSSRGFTRLIVFLRPQFILKISQLFKT